MPEHSSAVAQPATSESEEMYLITTARAIEEGVREPVPVSRIAADLGVSAVSANQMIRKLEARGLMQYEPYKGASLTEDGRRIALSILRRRRLWGVFLFDHLGLSAARADEVACDMEHITPDDVADLLNEYLGDPAVGPNGRPIPHDGSMPRPAAHPLAESHVGVPLVVSAVTAPETAAAYLRDQGVVAGARVELVAIAADGSALLSAAAASIRLTAAAAAWVLVEAT